MQVCIAQSNLQMRESVRRLSRAVSWQPIVVVLVVVVQVNDTIIRSIVTDSQTDYIFVTNFDGLTRHLDNIIRQACRVRLLA